MPIAITRDISPNMGDCELTHLNRESIDTDEATLQHMTYEMALDGLGCEVIRIPGEPTHPDSVFIEDTAVVLDELAIITRPGAPSRREETKGVATILKNYRELSQIKDPGTLDGGDVLVCDKMIFVGQTARTNEAGIQQLQEYTAPHNYRVIPVPVDGCLHLKSAVTLVADGMVLLNPAWIPMEPFTNAHFSIIEIDPTEPYAANGLLIEARDIANVIYPENFPKTQQRLAKIGISVLTVDMSELQKAEGAVTCCSLILKSAIKNEGITRVE